MTSRFTFEIVTFYLSFRMIRKISCGLLLLLLAQQVFPQHTISAVKTLQSPVIDGIIEEIWDRASLVDEFIQRVPFHGMPVSEKTEFLFLYDKNNLYIAARCYHEDPADISSRELARDVSLGQEDRIQIILDTYLDGRNGYWFQIGPRGSIGDALVSENGRAFNKSWDGIWDGKSTIHEKGWDAEIVIPFKTVGFKKGRQTWGIKLIRNIKKRSESSYWPPTTLDAERFQVSDAGRIEGLEGISQGIGLDVVPFLTSGYSKKREKDGTGIIDAGVDAFYQITPSLKAALTVNTDFAQTEVDARQINLTRFSLFFPEKRDFFLDGANYFNFGITGDNSNPHKNRLIPYFSRRIGLDPAGQPVPVQYGGKFTGQAGPWNIGMLHIKDDNYWDNKGYSVARISRNIGKQSYIGMIGTHGNSFGKDRNALGGLDLQLATTQFRDNKNLVYNLYGLKSFTPDLQGDEAAWGTEICYPNDFLYFRQGYMQIGRDFVSGLGFVPRKDIRNIYGGIGMGPRPEKYGILQIRSGINYYLITSLSEGGLLSSMVNLRIASLEFLSGESIETSFSWQKEVLNEDFHIMDSVVIPADTYDFSQYEIGIHSAQRRKIWARTEVGRGSFYTGTRTDWMIETGWQVAVPVYIGAGSERIYVTLEEGEFITQIFRFNLNLLFSPNLTWYNFAQYDSESETLGIQSRFQWIIRPGKEIFLIWNSPHIRDPLSRFQAEEYEARLKVKYTLRL